jgi:hypothetical protein
MLAAFPACRTYQKLQTEFHEHLAFQCRIPPEPTKPTKPAARKICNLPGDPARPPAGGTR